MQSAILRARCTGTTGSIENCCVAQPMSASGHKRTNHPAPVAAQCPLWSRSGQPRVRSDLPLNATHDFESAAASKMGNLSWAIMEKSADKCVVITLFASCDRCVLQRFIRCFVSQNFFFRPFNLARGSVAHRCPPPKYQREFFTAAPRKIQTVHEMRRLLARLFFCPPVGGNFLFRSFTTEPFSACADQ